MKDHSTMTMFGFSVSILWKFIVGFIWYKNLLFRVLPHQDVYDSIKVIWILMFVSTAFFEVVLWRWKNQWTATACFVIPFGLYTIKTYAMTSASFIRIVIVGWIFISLTYSILLLTRKVSQKGKKNLGRVYRNRISRCIYSVSCVSATAMLVLMAGVGWNRYFGTALVSSSVKPEGNRQTDENEDMMEINRDTVLKLSPDKWKKLDTKERMDVLQTVCNIEVHELGMDDPVTVQGDNLSPSMLGAYSDAQHLIWINLNHMENDPAEKVLSTLLHEVYHSYEYQLVNLYQSVPMEYRDLVLFRNTKYYIQEDENYINGSDDYEGYASQHLEMDSEKYAEGGVEKYYSQIAVWMEEKDM